MKLACITGGLLACVVCAVLAEDVFTGATESAPMLIDQIEAVPDNKLNLQGQWVSNCFWFEPGVYQVRTFEFVLDQLVTITTLSYPDKNCQQNPANYAVVSATWDLGEALTTEEGLDAYALDVLLKEGDDQQLMTIKQIVSLQQDHLLLGINQFFDKYPQRLDWDIEYTRIE